MKFYEYDLYHTVWKVYERYEANKLKPRSADWFIYRAKRARLMQDVLDELPKALLIKDRLVDICTERVLKAWDDFGKNKEKYKTLISIAEVSGRDCYCNGSFSKYGPCSDVMTFELLLPPTVGRIVCKKHLSVRK